MKKILTIFSLLAVTVGVAQSEGEIKYTTKINMHAELEGNENAEMLKQMIPEFQTMNNVLLFNEAQSVYQNDANVQAEEEPVEETDGQVQIKIEMDEPNEIIYTDIANGIVIEQRDLMGKLFLVTDTLKAADWHVLDEQQVVSGLMCQKAMLYTERDTITAWFTPEIPVSTGPSGFGGLPGLIVHVSMDGGNFQITAAKIIPREIASKEIKAPTKGKKVTDEEFGVLQEKKMKEMQEQFEGMSGDGNVIMITN